MRHSLNCGPSNVPAASTWISALLVTVAVSVSVAFPTPQAETDERADTTVVARFDTATVELSEFERRYARSVGSVDAARADSVDQYAEFLERHVDYRLKLLDARRRGLDENLYADPGITARPLDLARRHLVQQTHERRLRTLYEHGKEELNVSHVVVRIPGERTPADTLEAYRRIQAVVDSIDSGALTFSQAAAGHSDAPNASENSGHVGWISAGTVAQKYERRVWNTPEGDRTPIFRTPGAYYVVKVHARRPGRAPRRISHIFVNPRGDTARGMQRARSFLDSLETGMDFSRLAYQYSDHSQTANRGGDFGWVRYTELHEQAPRFARGAFRLDSVGAVSDVLRSQYGYHVIKVTDMQDSTSFAAARSHLEERMKQLPRGQNIPEQTARRSMRRLGHSVDSALVDRLIDRLPSDRTAAWDQVRAEGVPDDLEDRVVATIGDSTFTLGRLEPRLRAVQAAPDVAPTIERELDEFLEERVFAHMVPILEEEDTEFASMLNEYRNGSLLYRVSQEAVWRPAQRDTQALREYFRTHRDRYRWPRRYRVLTFRSSDESALEELVQMFDDGGSVDRVVGRVEDLPVEIDSSRIADSLGTPVDRAFSMESGDHSDVLSHRAEHLVLYLAEVEPPRQKTFEEARMQVVQEYQQVLEDRWVEQLRERYDARIYPDRLRAAFTGDGVPDGPVQDPMPTRTTSRSQDQP